MLSHVSLQTVFFLKRRAAYCVFKRCSCLCGFIKTPINRNNENICPKHALINTYALNTLNKGIHTQRRADGRPAFSDGTEYEDALVARFVSQPPFCLEKSVLH